MSPSTYDHHGTVSIKVGLKAACGTEVRWTSVFNNLSYSSHVLFHSIKVAVLERLDAASVHYSQSILNSGFYLKEGQKMSSCSSFNSKGFVGIS